MQLLVEVKLDPELKALVERLIEALCNLATVIAPLTGFRIKKEE